jgi:Predicted membrane protein (DUF2079)
VLGERRVRAVTVHDADNDALGPGFNLLGNHFQAAIGVLAPFFRVFPSAATLLSFQALLAAVSVFPVVTAAFVFTGRSTGRLIGFAYAFPWDLQQMIVFDGPDSGYYPPVTNVPQVHRAPLPARPLRRGLRPQRLRLPPRLSPQRTSPGAPALGFPEW